MIFIIIPYYYVILHYIINMIPLQIWRGVVWVSGPSAGLSSQEKLTSFYINFSPNFTKGLLVRIGSQRDDAQ